MDIFFPFQKELNPYLDEIIKHSRHSYTYDSYLNYRSSYALVNIHWPEALFNWHEPSEEELVDLEERISIWKKKSLLVYTKHDFERNKGTTKNFTRLFQIIEKNSDVFIHLGEYSKVYYQKKYPKAIHKVIFHPLYEKSFPVSKKADAKKQLGIKEAELVMIAPGTIRSYAERDLVFRAFDHLEYSAKVLICTNVHAELRYDFPGRIMLKRFLDVKDILVKRFKRKYQPPQYFFTYEMVSAEELALKMSAADLVFIPRRRILNSGNVFLGLTFEKVIIGPDCGNISEQLKELGYPLFDPNSLSSVANAIEEGVKLHKAGYKPPEELLQKYKPENIAREQDIFFQKLIENEA